MKHRSATRRLKTPNGAGSIRKRPDGRWEARFTATDQTGMSLRRSLYGSSEVEARSKLLEMLSARGKGALVVKRGRGPTLGAFLTDWMAGLDHRVSETTARRYRQLVQIHVIAQLGHLPLASLRPEQVDTLLSHRLEVVSPRTTFHVRAVLRTALNTAVRNGLLARNPAALSHPPRVERRELAILAREQLRTLIEASRDDHLGPLWALLATTGLRLGEALGLRWSDFDERSGALVVRRSLRRTEGTFRLAETKTRLSVRTIPLATEAVEALRRQRGQQAEDQLRAGSQWHREWDDLIFRTVIGHPIDGSGLNRRFGRFLQRAGLPAIRIHDLRHSAASAWLSAGLPVREVQEQLGHASPTLTLGTYGHVLPSGRWALAEVMDNLMRG